MTPQVKSLSCPQCGGPLTIRAFERTLSVVCPQCLSILDAKDPNLKILQTFQAKERIEPLIPLGARGKVRGDAYEAIGFQVRSFDAEGVPDEWSEYLLFNPFKGFRYLTEYKGHWNDVTTLKSVPEAAGSGFKPAVKYLGQTYVHFDTVTATTSYVLGEFPWQARVGETAAVKDYIAAPHMLSSETTEGETVWSLGEYVTGAQVWEMFQLPGHPPVAGGYFPNQPSPYLGRVKGMWSTCLNLLSATFALALLFYLLSPQREVFRRQYSFSQGMQNDASFVTEPFEVTGHPRNVEVSVHTNLDNSWAYFNFALINEGSGQAYDFGREVSRYHGRDSDGNWSEGSAADRAIIPQVAPGRYYLRVEPEMAQNAGPMIYDLRVRYGVPSMSFFWIAAGLVLVPPIFSTWRSITFERRRWQQSDYAPSSSSSGDDD